LLDAGHLVLTRPRAGAAAALAMMACIALLAAAPPAIGAPVAHAAAAAQQEAGRRAHANLGAGHNGTSDAASDPFPASAKNLLAQEMREAWHISRGTGVTVAVLSTAVDSVSGLAGKLTIGPDYAPVSGASAVDGTILASLIAGSGTTGTGPFGSIGRAPGARILAEQIVDYNSSGGSKYQQAGTWQAIMAEAIRYAVNHGAGVIVTFEAGTADSASLEAAVAYAISRDVVVLGTAFAGRGQPTPLEYPDSSPGVINFAGQPLTGLPKPSNRVSTPSNSSVLLTAPDNVLFATGPGSQPYTAWGNYSEIAWVAGTVALIKSAYPHITPAQVARALAESASYPPAGGYNTTVGFGLLNPAGALHDAASLVRLGTTAAPGPGVVSPSARFGVAQARVINAVHHSTALLAGYAAAIGAGVILLAVALVLAVRRPRARVAAG
jgi:hypothetical protein